jgi:hypothetical protein
MAGDAALGAAAGRQRVAEMDPDRRLDQARWRWCATAALPKEPRGRRLGLRAFVSQKRGGAGQEFAARKVENYTIPSWLLE